MAVATLVVSATAPTFDPAAWNQDLDQVQQVLSTKYANFEWAVFQREADLPTLFADTKARIGRATNDADARSAFDRLVRKLGDEHVEFEWPRSSGTAAPTGAPEQCAALGYDARSRAHPLAALMNGYRSIATASSSDFPIGLLNVGKERVGIVEIGVFEPFGFPEQCHAAVKALAISPDGPCDDACSDRVDMWVSARLTRELSGQLRELRSAGATVLLVDIAGNGGGTEWAEAVARMLTPTRLHSEIMGFVRGEHWTRIFDDDQRQLDAFAQRATGADRELLVSLSAEAAEKKKEASTPCDSAALWRGQRPSCEWLPKGFFGSGLLESADPLRLHNKPWAPFVFTPMKFPYDEGVWRGPLLVLIDRDVASAASEFAAVLQDNHVALLIGEPAGGGCGHTNGGTPTTLSYSKAVLKVPDCARFRADGTNEVMGIEPDVLVGFASADGPHVRAARLLSELPAAISRIRTPGAHRRRRAAD